MSAVPATLVREANALREAGRLAEAEAAYLRILGRWPSLPDCWFNLGVVQRRSGRFEAALASYQEALMRGISGPEEVHLNRAVIYCDCLRQSEAAERELREALRLNASYVPALLRYDRAAQERVTEQLIAAPARTLAGRAPTGASGPRPIFVCGMFRSGSTLAEQLIAGHPGVAAGGELEVLPEMIARELLPFPESLAAAPEAKLMQLAGQYRERIAALFTHAACVTDKRPDNFFCIGLIKTLFPDALIVHTTRDALDNCLSVYFLHLDPGMSYALDLMDTGHFYRQYRRLMAHWKQLYGAAIVDFDYDRFVSAPEAAGSALFEALGLEWDPRFLEFPRSGRAARTASVWQVREPLYRHSSGRARHYEKELAPLREYLADLLPPAAVAAEHR